MRVLAINPGSTSTKIAFFRDGEPLMVNDIRHTREELSGFARVWDQLELRTRAVEQALAKAGLRNETADAVIGRGGLLAPMQGGTCAVEAPMLRDLERARRGEHPCNLGAPIAKAFADRWNVPAYITDPVVTDEMDDAARLTGLPAIRRRSLFHALNQRAAARQACRRLGRDYADSRLVVVHMGGGVSIGAHRLGRVVDVVNALDGEGPFSAERTGALPLLPVLDLLEKGETDIPTLRRTIQRHGGFFAHLGTNDLREVERRIDTGDETARQVFDAYVWNIAKHAWSMAAPLMVGGPEVGSPEVGDTEVGALEMGTPDGGTPKVGTPKVSGSDVGGPEVSGPEVGGSEVGGAAASAPRVDAVVLTGGMAFSQRLVDILAQRLSPLAKVVTVPGEEEMNALDAAARRALSGEDPVGSYAP